MHHSDSATVTTVDTLAKILDVCGELRASEQVDERAVTGCSFDSRAVSAGDGFDVDMDTFMAVSFQYPSDMNVKPEDREKLTNAANAIIALSDINKKIGGKQIITCDSGDCVILIMKDKSGMRDLIPQIKETALQEVEKIESDRKIRVGIGTIESGIKGIKHTYSNSQDAVTNPPSGFGL